MIYPIKPLILVAILTSIYLTLPSLSILLAMNSYSFISNAFNPDENVIVVYDANAKTPATSRLPLSLYLRIASVKGIEAISPEVIAFTSIGNKLRVIRGVDITLFPSVVKSLRMIEGRTLHLNDSLRGIVGYNLAKELNLRVGEKVMLRSMVSDEFLEIEIVGIFETDEIYDEEILVPLFLAASLAGIPSDYVSFFRIKVSDDFKTQDLYNAINENRTQNISGNSLVKFLIAQSVQPKNVNIAPVHRSMEEFLIKQLNVSQNTLIGFSAITFFLTIFLLNNIIEYYINEVEKGILILKMIGAKRKTLFKYFLYFWLLIFLLAVILNLLFIHLFTYLFNNISIIEMLGYKLFLNITWQDLMIIYMIGLIISINLLYLNVKKI